MYLFRKEKAGLSILEWPRLLHGYLTDAAQGAFVPQKCCVEAKFRQQVMVNHITAKEAFKSSILVFFERSN